MALYGYKFIENGKSLDPKCLKDFLLANLKTAGYVGQRSIEYCGKSNILFTFVGVFNLSL